MKKDELISVFPTAVQIYKYENSIDKELNYIENLPYIAFYCHNKFINEFRSE